MGHSDPQSMQTAALALGGFPIKSSLPTTIMFGLALVAWGMVGVAYAAGVEDRLYTTALAGAIVLVGAAIAAKCTEVICAALDRHARRLEVSTIEHGQSMRKQILNVDWLATARYRGERRAEIDAAIAMENLHPGDTGPFQVINGGAN